MTPLESMLLTLRSHPPPERRPTFHSFARAKTFTGWLASNGQSLDKKCEIEAHVNEQSHVNEGIEAHVNEQSHVNEGIEAR